MRSTMAVVMVVLLSGLALAEIPQVINYQGKVTDASGNPIADGNYPMAFTIYDAVSGGSALWSSGVVSVAVAGGVFSSPLGESPQPALTLDFSQDYWLAITVGGDLQSPRVRMGSVGYAYMASGLVPGTEVSDSVTTGTNAAIKGTNTATTGSAYGLFGESASEGGSGVYGVGTTGLYGEGTTYGVDGTASVGAGVMGSGPMYGVYGDASNAGGQGVYGHGPQVGVHGSGSIGVYGGGVTGVHGYGTLYGVYYEGGIGGTGKMRVIVRTSQGPTGLGLHATAGDWFEDFGEGQLVNGRCHVELDPVFLETVTIDAANPMKVFVEPSDENCNGTAVKKGETGFDVIELWSGTSNGTFDYRVVAKRKGFEATRLEVCEAARSDSYLYPELREKDEREVLGVRRQAAKPQR